jgi:hypothetical protein
MNRTRPPRQANDETAYAVSPVETAGALTSPYVATLAPVSSDRILRVQGYSDLLLVRKEIRAAAEWAAKIITSSSSPQIAFRRVGIVRREADLTELSGGIALHGAALVHELRGCDEVIVFVQTLGDGPDQQASALADGGENLLEALLLETAGWLALEEVIKQFKQRLSVEAARGGRKLRKRLGPGYTYASAEGPAMWPLEDQRHLFAAFGDDKLPVRLLESCAMQPKLSRSGLFGEGPAPRTLREFPSHSEGRPGRL